MRVVAFNGSARKGGNTSMLVDTVLGPLEAAGIETEKVEMAGESLRGCRACGACYKKKDRKCRWDDDALNGHLAKMDEADGIILASPVYFSDVTAEMKALIDRAGYVAMANGQMFRRKIGASVVAVRRAGGIHTFDSMNHFFLINQMVIPGSSYWNIGIGRAKGEVADDEEGLTTMRNLGENMAWLLERTASARD